jgi:TetR/AcrR family transcriptional regulator, mexJK operon transcriptional repressor
MGGIVREGALNGATAFLSLVVSGPTRIIVSGNVLEDQEIEERIRFAIRLFLDGVRRR